MGETIALVTGKGGIIWPLPKNLRQESKTGIVQAKFIPVPRTMPKGLRQELKMGSTGRSRAFQSRDSMWNFPSW